MNDLEKIRRANFWRVVYIGICFMMLFSAFFSAQHLMTQIYRQLGYDDLGQICFFAFSAMFALTCIIAPNYYIKLSIKTGLIWASINYLSFILAGVLATYCEKYQPDSAVCDSSFIKTVNVLCAGIVGCSASFLWLFQAKYVNACADEQIRGVCNGVFYSLMQASQISSGVIATFLLGNTDQFTFYLMLLAIGTVAVIMFFFLQAPLPYDTQPKQEAQQVPLRDALKGFYNVIKEQKYHFLYTSVVFYGIAFAFYATYLGSAVTTTVESGSVNLINQRTGIAFLLLSVGAVLGGVLTGPMADKYDHIKMLGASMLINEAALAFTLLTCFTGSFTLALIAGFLWGYGDSAMGTMVNVIIGSKFNSEARIFAAWRFSSCLGCVFTTTCGIFLEEKATTLFVMAIAGSMLAFHMLFYYCMRNFDQKKEDHLSLTKQKLLIELEMIERC